MAVSKAFLKRLYHVVKDREKLAAIRKFLTSRGHEIRSNRLRIINGKLKYTGTIGSVTYYWWCGENKIRRKSSLNGKRFQKDPAFEKSRQSAQRFAEGNQIASRLYRMVKIEQRKYPLFCSLKKAAIQLIKEGKTAEEAKIVILEELKTLELLKI